MLFKILYVLFLICQLLYGSFYIGGIVTPRQLMTIVMLILCYRMDMIRFDKYIKAYVIFILFFGISSALGGHMDLFFRQFVGLYLVAYTAYQSTKILVHKYRSENLIFYTFASVGVFDAVITIGQYFYVPWAIDIVRSLHFIGYQSLEDFQDDHSYSSLEGYTVPGIVGDVMNGYFLPIVCIFLWYNRNVLVKLPNFILWLIAAMGLFFVQQRTGFAAGITASIYILYQMLSSRMGEVAKFFFFVLAAVVIVVGFHYGFEYISESESRYTLGLDMSTRTDLYSRCIDYIFANPWGGIFECINIIGMPHNLLLNAFIYGGYIGGLFVLYIICDQLKICVKSLMCINTKEQFALLLMILAWLSFFVCSIAHNLSIVTGDVHVWIFWAAILCLIERGNGEPHKNIYRIK